MMLTDVLGEQKGVNCTQMAPKTGRGEQNAPICTPKRSPDILGVQERLICTPTAEKQSPVSRKARFAHRRHHRLGVRQRRNNSGANWRKRDVGGPVQGAVAVRKEPWAEAPGANAQGPGEAMTAFCLTNVPGPCGPDKEEFAVKRPMPLPFSPA